MALYISLAFAIFIFCVLVVFLQNFGLNIDKIENRLLKLTSNEKDVILDDDLNKSLSERFIIPLTESIVKFLSKFVPDTGTNNEKTENLRKQLRQAGISLMPSEYSAIKIIVIVGNAVLFFLLSFIINVDNLYFVLILI